MSSTNLEKRLLSFRELCSIIKTCRDSRVAELKFGDLHVTFHKPVGEGPRIVEELTSSTHTTHPDKAISDEQRKQLEKHALIEDEIRLKEDRLDQMLIESPSEYEELQARGDLEEDEGTGHVDDAETDRRRAEPTL